MCYESLKNLNLIVPGSLSLPRKMCLKKSSKILTALNIRLAIWISKSPTRRLVSQKIRNSIGQIPEELIQFCLIWSQRSSRSNKTTIWCHEFLSIFKIIYWCPRRKHSARISEIFKRIRDSPLEPPNQSLRISEGASSDPNRPKFISEDRKCFRILIAPPASSEPPRIPIRPPKVAKNIDSCFILSPEKEKDEGKGRGFYRKDPLFKKK